MRKNDPGLFARLALSAALLLSQFPMGAIAAPMQGAQTPDAAIKISEISNEKLGGGQAVLVIWAVALKGGATEQGFVVRAVVKIANGGGTIVRTLNLPAGSRKAGFPITANDLASSKGAGSKQPALKETNKPVAKKKSKDGKESAGDSTQGTIQPAPNPGIKVVIESADVTVTGRFNGGAEAVNVIRDFVPPAQTPTGELRVKSGNNQGEVQIANLIDVKKSPRAAQCAAGRDCFEVLTATARNAAGAGGNGVVVAIEVLYADGSRKTDSKAVGAPGRPVLLSVDNPAGTAFTSVRVQLRSNGVGAFTRSANRSELLSF